MLYFGKKNWCLLLIPEYSLISLIGCKKGDISLTPFTNPPQLLRDLYVEGGIGQAVEEAVGQAVEEAVRQAVDSKTSS